MQSDPQTAPSEALGESEAFLAFSEALSKVAKVNRPVLIIGERGTGKELAAARLHFLSPRWQEPFGALNCGALAATLIESELFGYEAGAFTGAAARRAGRFEAADGGTLFLDEIGNAPLTVQEKILRVVEYGVFERVGGSRPVVVDTRIIAATNADLPAMSRQGSFKQDLLDRLSFEVLMVPPLRARGDDVLLLANHFAARMAHELGWSGVPVLSATAREQLVAHDWPGNVRELKNVVERAVYRCEMKEIGHIDFNPFRPRFPGPAPEPPPLRREAPRQTPLPAPAESLPAHGLKEDLRRRELHLLKTALARARHNQKKAAELLGLSYHQLRGLLRKHSEVLQATTPERDT